MGRFVTKGGFVYIMASGRVGTLYIGVTSRFEQRLHEHRSGTMNGFTRRYDVGRLVWFEQHDDIVAAIRREKQLKKWEPDWKIRLIETDNPAWRDLAEDFGFPALDR